MSFIDGFNDVIDGIKKIFGGLGKWIVDKVIK